MADGEASSASLYEQAEAFARELSETLVGSLPSSPEAVAEVSDAAERVIVRPERDVPLLIDGERFGDLRVSIRCQLDSRGTWLAVESSGFQLVAAVDRAPIIRFDYLRQPKAVPAAHVQVHAHRGALTHLLSQAGHSKPHDIAGSRAQVGGKAFWRPVVPDGAGPRPRPSHATSRRRRSRCSSRSAMRSSRLTAATPILQTRRSTAGSPQRSSPNLGRWFDG